MAKKGLEPMHDEHVNVTPLIDIVMCLIIFFMVCGKLAKDEVSGEITVPKAANSQELTDQRGKVIVNILKPETNESGAVIAPPKVKIGTNDVNYSQLDGELRKLRQANPDIKVTLRADETVAYEHIAPVLVACAMADIKSVHFSTVMDE